MALEKGTSGKRLHKRTFFGGRYVRKTIIMKINIALTFLKSHENDHL